MDEERTEKVLKELSKDLGTPIYDNGNGVLTMGIGKTLFVGKGFSELSEQIRLMFGKLWYESLEGRNEKVEITIKIGE